MDLLLPLAVEQNLPEWLLVGSGLSMAYIEHVGLSLCAVFAVYRYSPSRKAITKAVQLYCKIYYNKII